MHCSAILLSDSVVLIKPLDQLLKLHWNQSRPKQKNIISRFSIFEFSEFPSPGRPVAVRSITRRQHDCGRAVLEVGHRVVPKQPPLTVHATQGLCSTNKHLILVDAHREILFFHNTYTWRLTATKKIVFASWFVLTRLSDKYPR